MSLFCSRCGAENLDFARHCGECGAMLDEALPVERAAAAEARPIEGATSPQCVRCGAYTHDNRYCPVCSTLQPLPEHLADPYFYEAIVQFPELLRSPIRACREMRYRNHLGGLLRPLLGMALAVPLGWGLAILPWLNASTARGESASFEPGTVAAFLVMLGIAAPFVFLGYCGLVQGLAMAVGGSGTLERTTRLLGALFMSTAVICGGWITWMRWAQLALPAWIPYLNNPGIYVSPVYPLYALMPTLLWWGAALTIVLTVVYQGILLAAANWLDVTRSVIIHLVIYLPLVWWVGAIIYRGGSTG